jgi:uncharacterized repeat protein (TIGR01451 family)
MHLFKLIHVPALLARLARLGKPLGLALCTALLLLAGPARAAMYGYATNASGIYRINTQTAATTPLYTLAPFDGTTFVAGAALRPSDGMLFFLFNNTANQALYRWDPATPAIAPVLLGTTGSAVPYIHRLAFHPTNGSLYGNEYSPATRLWTFNQASGAATAVATISGLSDSTSGDLAFNPLTGELYTAISNTTTSAILYRIPLAGGAVANVGTISGLTDATATTLTSAMFNAAGTLFIAGGGQSLFTAPLTGGVATLVGTMGVTPQDFGSAPSPSPTISKAFTPAAVAANINSTLTITLSNTYANPQRGAAFTDTYPAGLVNAPAPGASTTCGGTVSAAAGGGAVALSGATIPANGSCTVTVSVRSATLGTYTNIMAAGALTTVLAFNDSAATGTLLVRLFPSLTHLKTVAVTSDPVNGTTNPKHIPGAQVLYTLRVTNSGAGTVDNNTVVITDPIPANTNLFVGDLGAAGSGPIVFVQGSPASGLSWTFTSLASTTDDVEFSSDNGATWTYVPTPPYDAAVNRIRLKPKGTMAGATGGINPYFELRFQVRVK